MNLGFVLARQVLYCLSYTASPFALIILGIGFGFLPMPNWIEILLF
jgi:hypothetical protein